EKDCYVYASPIKSNCAQSKSKVCSYKIYLARFYEEKVINGLMVINNQLIGIDPKLAETLVENALTQNYLKPLSNIKSYKREVSLLNSRFDFAGVDEQGKYFVLEVKNVPLADYADVCSSERKKMIKNGDFANIAINQKISYFPDGYRKKKDNTSFVGCTSECANECIHFWQNQVEAQHKAKHACAEQPEIFGVGFNHAAKLVGLNH
ncbi:MAG: Sugar fermentation stimulation protein domain, partial [Bacteroidota bacterium]